MAGRLYFSISRAATMPITPGCQSSPETTSTRSRWRAGSASSVFLGGSEHFLFRLLALGVDLRQAGGNAGGLGFIGAKQQL